MKLFQIHAISVERIQNLSHQKQAVNWNNAFQYVKYEKRLSTNNPQ